MCDSARSMHGYYQVSAEMAMDAAEDGAGAGPDACTVPDADACADATKGGGARPGAGGEKALPGHQTNSDNHGEKVGPHFFAFREQEQDKSVHVNMIAHDVVCLHVCLHLRACVHVCCSVYFV